MVTHREILVVRRAGDRAVAVDNPPAVRLVPGPDFTWSIIERGGHGSKLQALSGHTIARRDRPAGCHLRLTGTISSSLRFLGTNVNTRRPANTVPLCD